ncbi:DnaT-like ssDNA-binding domain-containing protein [Bacterioplanoides sp.]|uniref:DnaT-like ssDNA-binding domain-containing protein n=1 Tax=Bacterioplanoides sp. TaxID=2066072 RepID=UPI003B001337
MPSHPLFTDKTIPLSATLAATIGLEEAVLLTVLNDAASLQEQAWVRLYNQTLRNHLPFWDDVTIRRVLRSLIDKGLVQLQGEVFPDGEGLIFSFGQPFAMQQAALQQAAPQQRKAQQPVAPQASAFQGQQSPHQPLGQQWQPSADTLIRLKQHGISSAFAMTQLDSFILKGQELGANRRDWNHRFFQHVKSQWAYAQNDAARQQKQLQQQAFGQPTFANQNPSRDRTAFTVQADEAKAIQSDWLPSQDACQILQRAGIDPQFIQDAVPEFVLYWAERGDAFKTWNSKFIQHVRQQWARYSASVEHSTVPTRIAENWQPDPDCFDILSMGHIDHQFAHSLVPEFVLYWRDSNQVHTSWNSRFLQYVKQQWAKRLAQTNNHSGNSHSNNNPAGEQHGQHTQHTAAQPGYTTAEASVQRLKDTSW